MSGFRDRVGGKAILLAEANAVLRDHLAALLHAHGYHVISVRSGDEAIVLLNRNAGEIDIVYADVDLPKRSGLEVFLKAKSMRPGIRFILGSGPLGEGTQRSLTRIGIHAILQKPFPPRAFLHALIGGDSTEPPQDDLQSHPVPPTTTQQV